MKLYLAGPMRHQPESNFPAFHEAAEKLRRAGYDVANPAEGGVGNGEVTEEVYRMLIRRGLRMVLDCDGVAVLPGWEASNGASLEVDIARGAGMTVADVGVWEQKGLAPLRWAANGRRQQEAARALEPQRYYPGDAGFDLICSAGVRIGYRQFVDVPCGISVELPEGVWALIIGRSSTLRKRQLMVAPGVIDNGWRGELYAGVWNLGEQPTAVDEGDRIAQLIPFPLVAAGLRLERAQELSESDRGTDGFGSTGP